jgi:hypothetical protein
MWLDLLLPSLVSAVLVFIASSVVHMVLKLHNRDYKKLANEDDVRAVITKGAAKPGQYVIPHCLDSKEMASPEMVKKHAEGPNAVVYIGPTGAVKLGPFLGKWFAYSFVIALLAGHVAGAALGAGAPHAKVFHTVGLAAWLAYAWQSPSDSIWKMKPWAVTLRGMFDGLIYAALTAGAFVWLWPE